MSALQTFSGRRASQNEMELHAFIALLHSYGVTSYAEIGARDGDTFYSVVSSLPPGSRGVAVDLPGGLWGKKTTRTQLEKAVADLKAKGYEVSTLFGDSTTPAIQNLVRLRGPYDAMLIDGSHLYNDVKKDWQAYGKLAKVCAFHDIVGLGEKEKVHDNPVEVPILWAEIKAGAEAGGYSTVEFIDEGSRMGIGCALWESRP